QEESKKSIGQLKNKKSELNNKIESMKSIEEENKKIKEELEQIRAEERKLEIEKTAFEKEIEGINKSIDYLEKEIDLKLKIKSDLERLSYLKTWIEDFFVELTQTMEKQIMLKIFYDFNQAFQEWFNCLIEDEGITARLDGVFNPIINQNGYDMDIENLSGGEKTACALAYRLALNKTINDLITEIKTKELIILDEPTDGFSSEQLDKLRTVLEQLNMKQTILVSHESKIESFVNNIIRIGKQEHASFVL
ncbi:unnamed protein product, partial [marine sediment metagenome]